MEVIGIDLIIVLAVSLKFRSIETEFLQNILLFMEATDKKLVREEKIIVTRYMR